MCQGNWNCLPLKSLGSGRRINLRFGSNLNIEMYHCWWSLSLLPKNMELIQDLYTQETSAPCNRDLLKWLKQAENHTFIIVSKSWVAITLSFCFSIYYLYQSRENGTWEHKFLILFTLKYFWKQRRNLNINLFCMVGNPEGWSSSETSVERLILTQMTYNVLRGDDY